MSSTITNKLKDYILNIRRIQSLPLLQNKKELLVKKYRETFFEEMYKWGKHDVEHLVSELDKITSSLHKEMYHTYIIPTEHIFWKNDFDLLKKAENIFEKQKDKDLFRALINHRTRPCLDELGFLDYITILKERKYTDFINKACINTVIEGGVADYEDTIKFQNFADHIYGFDPLLDLYKGKNNFDKNIDKEKTHLIPSALWETSGEELFFVNTDCLYSSCISASRKNTYLVQSISIDNFVKDNNIEKLDYLKLDIEGAELHALRGAIHTLKNHRPQIAVAIYHTKEHFWDIPLFLKSILDNYIFRLGHYYINYTETILYAIPSEIISF